MIQTVASKVVGFVECDSVDDYQEKAEALWESQGNDYPTTNISNDFDLGDFDLSVVDNFDLACYRINKDAK